MNTVRRHPTRRPHARWPVRPRTLAIILLAALIGGAGSARAQNQNETVGFPTSHVFESGQFGEGIDILNGGLNLSIPIGPSYQVSRYLSYQLQLSYGSKIWDHTPYPNVPDTLHGRSPMGLGFNLHFGRVYRDVERVGVNNQTACTWYFVTPDGGSHVLPTTGIPCLSTPTSGSTVDTTYYSLNAGFNQIPGWSAQQCNPNVAPAPVLRIVSPDGRLVYEFGHMVQTYTTAGAPMNCAIESVPSVNAKDTNYNRDFGGWYVTKIYEVSSGVDPLNPSGWRNWVAVDYDTTGQLGAASHAIRLVRDSLGRKIEFENECEPGVGGDAGCRDEPIANNNPERASVRTRFIHVPAFKPSTVIENPTTTRATYDFSYAWREVNNYDTAGCQNPLDCPHTSVNVLTGIVYPAFTAHGETPPRDTMTFEYFYDPLRYGELASRTLPTGAKIIYYWGDYYYVGPTKTRAIERKEIQLEPGVTAGEWSYTRQSEDPEIPGTYLSNPRFVTVTDPAHNDTVYHYRASSSGNWDDGLNYRVEYYEGTGPTRTLRRTETLEYDSDLIGGERTTNNIRLNRRITTYIDDSGKQSIVQYRDWNERGLWRETVESGDGIEGTRITRTNYGGTGDPTEFSYREVTDGSRVLSRVDNAYASRNLVLSIERLTLPTTFGTEPNFTASNGDLVTVYRYDPNDPANAVQEMEVGNQGVSSGPVGWVATNPHMRVAYTYQPGGLLATKEVYDFEAGAFFGWKATDLQRDGNTGLIYKSTDPADVATEYGYDSLGRLTDITPPSPELPTQVQYSVMDPATGAHDPRRTSIRQGSGSTYGCDVEASGDFLLTCYTYDALGRLVKTQKRAPEVNKKASYQTTRYDILGRPLFRSEWMWPNENPCAGEPLRPVEDCGTTYDYTDPATPGQQGEPADPFGRVRSVTTSDNQTAITSYFGQSSVLTVRGVAQAGGTTPDLITTYSRDVWGRLIEVIPPAGGGARVNYTYDLRDNMIEAILTDPPTLTVQRRSFEYDALNRIHVAVLPESGATVVTGYDALGNYTTLKDAAGNLTLRTFDGAGRLRQVQWQEYPKPNSPPTPSMVQENFYDGTGAGFGASAGRLTEVRSYDDAGAWVHTRQLYYQALNGRLSKERHQFAGAPAGSMALDVSVDYSYNPFGLLSRTSYPEGAPGKGGAFALAYNYANGHLLEAWDAQVCGAPLPGDPPGQGCRCTPPACTPQARAVLNPVDGIQELIVPGNRKTLIDPDRRNRPKQIRVANLDLSDLRYDSGPFGYDGAGNIFQMGANQYRYDAANRLAYVNDILGATSRQQNFTYDGFGNMTEKVLTLNQNPVPASSDTYIVSADTNRIVTHQVGSTSSSFVYDARGNVTKGDGRVYEPDGGNRIRSVRNQATLETEIARYAYDTSASRVRKDDRQRDLRIFYVRDVQGRLLSEFRLTQRGTYTPEWLKHHLYLGNRLVGLRENRVSSPPSRLAATASVVNATQGNINLSWLANPSDEGITPVKYRVYRSPNADPPSWIILGESTTTSYSDLVTRGFWYKYAISAITQETVFGSTIERESFASDPLRFRVNSTSQTGPQPSTPVSLTPIPGDRSVFLKWAPHPNAAIQNVVGYHVYRAIGGAALTKITQIPLVVPSFVNQGLTNGTTYRYAVTAINSTNTESLKTPEQTAVPSDYTPPAPPLGFRAQAACDGTSHVTLSWIPSPEAPQPTFTLYRDPPFPGGASSITVAGPTSYLDQTPAGNTAYVYWLRVADGPNLSEESLHVLVRTRGTNALPTPPRPLAEAGDGGVTLRIPTSGVDPSATAMRVYRKRNVDVGCENYRVVGIVAPLPGFADFPDGALANGTAYDYSVTTLRADGSESDFSPTALAIPLKAPSGFSQCIEDLGSTWKDGATKCGFCPPGATSQNCRWRRLVARWDPVDLPDYQQLNATTVDGPLGYLMGHRLYVQENDNIPNTADYYATLTPHQNDYQKYHCRDHASISCDSTTPTGCLPGEACDPPPNDGDYENYPETYCSQDNLNFGRCVNRRVGQCGGALGGLCFEDGDCSGSPCVRTRPAEPYQITYQDVGANTSVVKEFYYGGCMTATAVYRVYVNGSWRLVESGYADNYDPAQPEYYNRCLQPTPDVCYDFGNPQYTCPPVGPSLPPTPTTPTVSTPNPGAVRVSWEEPGSCQPQTPAYCGYQVTCATGSYCEVTEPNGDGTCKFENPVPCSTSFPCQTGQVCEPRVAEIAGYYIYAGEKDAKQYHFKPAAPVVATAPGTLSFTFNGLAPKKADSSTNNFHFRIASFDVSGRISELSPVSASITPQDLAGSTPAPGSVKTVIWTQTGPAPGRPAIKVAWLRGGTYTSFTGYRLWRSNNPAGTFCALVYDAVQQTLLCRDEATLGPTEVSTTGTAMIDDTVTEGMIYYYKVTAIASGVQSPFSAIVAGQAYPRSPQPLSPPASFRAFPPTSQISFTGINLDWCPNPATEGVTEYRVYRSTTSMGPYIDPEGAGLGSLIAVILPHCLNGDRRCEILTGGVVNESTTCLSQQDARTCVIVDTTVPPVTSGNPPIYYYVVTALRPDGAGGMEESPFSEENQASPNRIDGSIKQPAHDPDATPEVFCGDEYVRMRDLSGEGTSGATTDVSTAALASGSEAAAAGELQPDRYAPYRLIGDPPPWDPVDLPDPDAAPRFVYFHLDHLGSPRVITDESGAVVSEHHYMPFGEEMPYVAQNCTNKRQFTGHERDAEIGLDYMVARYYSPSLGRFLSTDPLGDGFEYVLNNPINFTDPTGLAPGLKCTYACVCIGEGRKDCTCEQYCTMEGGADEGAEEDGGIIGTAIVGPVPPARPQEKPQCGYLDFSASVGVGVLGPYLGFVFGVQRNERTGEIFVYGGLTGGLDAGLNAIGLPNFSGSQSRRGQSVSPGAFVAGSASILTGTRQGGWAFSSSGTDPFSEKGLVTSLAGISGQAAIVLPLGIRGPGNPGCR